MRYPKCGCLLLLVSLCAGAAPPPAGSAAVAVLDEGGFDPGTLNSLRLLTLQALQGQGLAVVELPALPAGAPEPTLGQRASAANAGRLFVLLPSRLGQKVMLELQERELDGARVLASASLPLGYVEEADVALPRLARAVVRHESAEAAAEVSTLTAAEARPYYLRPAAGFFALGFPVGLSGGNGEGAFGLSLAWLYETDRYQMQLTFLGMGGGGGSTWLSDIRGAYYLKPGDWTPYIGAGLGYMHIANPTDSGGGAGLTAEVGVELLRLRRVRVLVGLEALIPAYRNADGSYTPYFLLRTQLGF